MSLVICTRPLSVGRLQTTPVMRDAILRERMRLSGQRFRAGFVADFRPAREGGRRRLLPLV